jgi:hypothetical protein
MVLEHRETMMNRESRKARTLSAFQKCLQHQNDFFKKNYCFYQDFFPCLLFLSFSLSLSLTDVSVLDQDDFSKLASRGLKPLHAKKLERWHGFRNRVKSHLGMDLEID